MRFRNLDSNNDWQFGKGRGNYVQQNAAIGLNVKTRILSWVNDCFFDLGAGIDWVNRLGSKRQRALLELDLRRIILQSEGVVAISEFSTQLVDRKFTASYAIDTVYGKSYADTIERVI